MNRGLVGCLLSSRGRHAGRPYLSENVVRGRGGGFVFDSDFDLDGGAGRREAQSAEG
jgi:hypothetical protein